MAQPPFPSTTNVDGSNPGPNWAVLPDTVQMPTGNIWKCGIFNVSLTPAAIANTAASGAQTFATTGIGLLPTDVVIVTPPAVVAGIQQAGAFVSGTDTLSIQFINSTAGSLTPPVGVYKVTVLRIQPNWTAPVTGNQLDW
jgi:hypothetical protein